MDEFELIERYFRPLSENGRGVNTAIGDDAAILNIDSKEQLVVTTDTQIESVHFPSGADPEKVGFRSYATSLSDIAAMGATARWASLALTVSSAESSWLAGFSKGAAAALEQSGASLVGGDTTCGPLVITWNIIGTVPVGEALLRNGAQVGEGIYVSGTLGSAAAALEMSLVGECACSEAEAELRNRYWYPRSRIALATELRPVLSSCIDISDGLIADLSHLARSSHYGISLNGDRVPIAPAVVKLLGYERARQLALTGGDDYELCFTVPVEREAELWPITRKLDIDVMRIGTIVEGSQLQVIDDQGRILEMDRVGYRHFE